MKFKRNLLILSAILVGVLIVVAGCTTPIIEEEEGDVPTNGTILIAGTAVTTNDTTPTLTLSSTGATHMAFSGNGTTWSDWVAYATTYSTFNINTGAGCTSVDGTKIVYVKFKNDVGESTKVYDSIILDTVAPKLSTAAYTDVNSSGTVNSGDKITFTFNDEMDTTTVTSTNVATNLLLSGSKSYGTSPAVSWDSGLKICYVTLGTSPTIVVGTTTVNPSASVKDTAGNADNSTAVTISGTTTTVLSSVSISPVATSTTAGGAAVTLTATALNTALGNITSLCTFIWSISGTAGGAITSTTNTAIYTPPASGTGVDTITVTAVYAGVIKDSQAIINVGTGTDTTAPTATLTAPEAGDRTALVVTFNEALNPLTLAFDDIADLLASATNDAEGIPVAISVASVPSSVSWNTTNVNAPVATITIPSTTFVTTRKVRLNFVTDHVQDVKGNAILTATNVDAIVVDTTAPTATITTTGDNDGAIVAGETLVLTFNEAMTPTVINATNIDTMIAPNGGKTHLDGAGAIVSAVWSVGNTVLTVTYSAGTSAPTIVAADTLTPTGFTDVATNVIAPVAYTVLGSDF
jgi:hypothetical protein